MEPKQLMTEAEVARRLRVTTRTLQKWRRKRIGPAFIVLGGSRIRYDVEKVEEYERVQTRESA